MTEPLVSIVLCNYNQEHFVEHAIQSALDQTYSNCEIMVIDNGSTDNSRELLKKYANHPRIKLYLNEKNAPVTQRLNEGIQASQGEFVSILYADDYYKPEKTSNQMEAFARLGKDYGVVYSPGERLNVLTGKVFPMLSMKKSGNILREMFTEYHIEGFIDPISPLVRRECFEKFPFQESIFIEGEAIYFRIATLWKFFYLGEALTVMRDHMNNAGKAIKKTKTYEVKIISNLLQEPHFPIEMHALAKQYLSRAIRNYGWQALRFSGEKSWALECFDEAAHWSPSQAFHPRTLAGRVLAATPNPVLRKLNAFANQVLKRETIQTMKENNV